MVNGVMSLGKILRELQIEVERICESRNMCLSSGIDTDSSVGINQLTVD